MDPYTVASSSSEGQIQGHVQGNNFSVCGLGQKRLDDLFAASAEICKVVPVPVTNVIRFTRLIFHEVTKFWILWSLTCCW